MKDSETAFCKLLRNGIHAIKFRESASIEAIETSLGRAVGRNGGQFVEQWCRGTVSPTPHEVEQIAAEIMRRSSLNKWWLLRFMQHAPHPNPEVASKRVLNLMKDEQMEAASVGSTPSNTEQTQLSSATSAPSTPQQRPIAPALIGLLVIGVLVFIFLPRQREVSPVVQSEHVPMSDTDSVYNVITTLSDQQWRESCATATKGDMVIVQRSNGESQACINREVVASVGDFSAEWRFTIESGTASFIVGQNAQHYRVLLDHATTNIQFATVEKNGATETVLRELPIALQADTQNHLEIMRNGAELTFLLNDNLLLTTEDTLYGGDVVELWLGIGGSATADGVATITYESIMLRATDR